MIHLINNSVPLFEFTALETPYHVNLFYYCQNKSRFKCYTTIHLAQSKHIIQIQFAYFYRSAPLQKTALYYLPLNRQCNSLTVVKIVLANETQTLYKKQYRCSVMFIHGLRESLDSNHILSDLLSLAMHSLDKFSTKLFKWSIMLHLFWFLWGLWCFEIFGSFLFKIPVLLNALYSCLDQ